MLRFDGYSDPSERSIHIAGIRSEAWDGLCDYFWLKETLQRTFNQNGPSWLLKVRVVDTLSRRYEGVGHITERQFAEIVQEHHESEEDE